MMTDDPDALDQRLELGMKRKPRLAQLVLNDADALERDGISKSGAHGFRKSLFGCKAVRKKKDRPDRPLEGAPLLRRQPPPRKAFAVLVDQPGDALRLHDIDADAVDQAPRPSAAR